MPILRRIDTIVDPRINETLQTGAVGNRTYRVGESVYLFLEFTIVLFLKVYIALAVLIRNVYQKWYSNER